MDATARGEGREPTHVVGIGASAGGLAALESFFRRVPENSGMAFVVIQHLAPHGKSVMEELLGRRTVIPVHSVKDGMKVEADSAYLIPPNTRMTLVGNQLQLAERNPGRGVEKPVDIFFESLAEAAKEKAIAIILSGTGTDGSRGIREVARVGGLALAQAPESAQFDGMPRSAYGTGVCAGTLTPEEMPDALVEYARNPAAMREWLGWREQTLGEYEFERILTPLGKELGVDFSRYRREILGRRVLARMDKQGVRDPERYRNIVPSTAGEPDALCEALLGGSGEFFSEAGAFNYLAHHVMPGLFQNLKSEEGLRIWCAGCGTGEEAYSLAIAVSEAAETAGFEGRISVFATDVNRNALETASVGRYEAGRLRRVTEERLRRYFRVDGDGYYRVTPELRKLLIIAPHNLVEDAPFVNLHLACCRNVMGLLSAETQSRVLALFHFALVEGGILLVGAAEDLGPGAELFEALETSYRVFRKAAGQGARPEDLLSSVRPPRLGVGRVKNVPVTQPVDPQLLHDYNVILGRLHPGVMVSELGEVLQKFGEVGAYLAGGEGLGAAGAVVREAMTEAARRRAAVVVNDVGIERAGRAARVSVTVDPIWDGRSRTYHYYVTFQEEVERVEAASQEEVGQRFDRAQQYEQLTMELTEELESTKETLHATIYELRNSNERLHRTNHEMLATNEQLQSTNEELHSVNEELYSVNSEFERKNEELRRLNLDHEHLLGSMETGIIFLDRRLRIRKYNRAIGNIFKLIPHDIGRPIDHLAYQMEDGRALLEDIERVLATGEAMESHAPLEGRTVLRRVMPFRQRNGNLDGVLVTFTDVTRLKDAERAVSRANAELERLVAERTGELHGQIEERRRSEQALKESLEKYRVLFNAMGPLGYLITDGEGRIREANEAAREFVDASGGRWTNWAVEAVAGGAVLHDEEIAASTAGGTRWLSVSAAPVSLADYGFAVTMMDITERRAAVEALRASEERWRKLFETMREAFALFEMVNGEGEEAVDYRFVEVNSAYARLLGRTRAELYGRTMRELGETALWLDRFARVAQTGKATHFEAHAEAFGGYFEVNAFCPMAGYCAALFWDVSDRRRYQEEQIKRQKLESLGVLAGGIAHEFNNMFTAVIGNLSLALEMDGELRHGQLLRTTLENCERASAVAGQLLTLAHGGETVWEVLDVVRILKETVGLAARRSNVTVEWEVDAISAVEGDAGQMSQVFQNIVINAAQAMPDGGRLRIRGRNVRFGVGNDLSLAAGDYVRLEFADEGCGIAPEVMAKIFDPYFTTKSKGTGLGLASVHAIVRRHGGHVGVESQVGKGAVFTVHLPATAKAVRAAGADLPALPRPAQAGSRVLVMDDKRQIRQLLSDIVTYLGYEVSTVEDGAAAAAAYREAMEAGQRFDAVILDLTVPGGMGGLGAASTILAMDEHARLVVSSGHANDPILANCASFGFRAGVGKPYTASRLATVLHEVIHGAREAEGGTPGNRLAKAAKAR